MRRIVILLMSFFMGPLGRATDNVMLLRESDVTKGGFYFFSENEYQTRLGPGAEQRKMIETLVRQDDLGMKALRRELTFYNGTEVSSFDITAIKNVRMGTTVGTLDPRMTPMTARLVRVRLFRKSDGATFSIYVLCGSQGVDPLGLVLQSLNLVPQ